VLREQNCTSLSDTDIPPTQQVRSKHGKAEGLLRAWQLLAVVFPLFPFHTPHFNSELLGIFRVPLSLNSGLSHSPVDALHRWTRG